MSDSSSHKVIPEPNALPKPALAHALSLRCPHCGKTKLLRDSSWLQFRQGCDICRYAFEREDGYFTGAFWIINYTIGAVVGFASAVLIAELFPDWHYALVVGLAALLAGGAAFGFLPLGKSLWLYFDHVIHPLEPHERTQDSDLD